MGVRHWGAGKQSRRRRVKGQIPDGLAGQVEGSLSQEAGGSGEEWDTLIPTRLRVW